MEKKNSFGLLSYNIHKGFNLTKTQYTLDLIKKSIQESGADILCLQEVCGPNHHPVKEQLHPIHTQFEFLADGVWPHYAYGKNAVYVQGHHGNAILSKFPIESFHNLDISTNALEKRGLLHAKITWPQVGSLHVMTAHLNLLHSGRMKQCSHIAEYIQDSVGPKDHLVLAGDFNDWQESLSKEFASRIQLKEAFYEHHQKHAKTFPSIFPLLKLDRIYFRNLSAMRAVSFVGSPWRELSDHCPLLAEFS